MLTIRDSNDCGYGFDQTTAGARMKNLTDDVFNSIPGVTIIMSTLTISRDYNACASNLSQQFRNLVYNYPAGTRIMMADWNAAMTADMLGPDGIHPDDAGYKYFAAVWWDAIRKMESGIQPPKQVAGIDDAAVTAASTCSKKAGNAKGPIQIQKGSGHNDSWYVHSSEDHGVIVDARIQKGGVKTIDDAIPTHIFFAQMINAYNQDRSDALDDWIRILHNDTSGKNTYFIRENKGSGVFGDSQTIDVDLDCDSGPHYAWADFNNDGLADFFCLAADSAVSVAVNLGGNPPKFKSLGQVVPTHAGYTSEDVRIADIDGDGRADYCLILSGGGVGCSRNGGVGNNYYWQGFSTASSLRAQVIPHQSFATNASGIVFGDMNGDFRSDWMYIGDEGQVNTIINMRGWGKGKSFGSPECCPLPSIRVVHQSRRN
jgi:hypothetical protein